MEFKGTKGEWKKQPCHEGIEVYCKNIAIARLPIGWNKNNHSEAEANANLIASAPKLLKALIEVLHAKQAILDFGMEEEVKFAEEAIKEALGE